jgi:hypothetical protein
MYSFGNGTLLGSSIQDYLLREAQRRTTVVYVIKTTPAQDAAAMASAMKSAQRGPVGISRDNCASRSNRMLTAAGIPYPSLDCKSCIPGDLPPAYWPNLPGTAGSRAVAAGGERFVVPQGSTQLPSGLVPIIK